MKTHVVSRSFTLVLVTAFMACSKSNPNYRVGARSSAVDIDSKVETSLREAGCHADADRISCPAWANENLSLEILLKRRATLENLRSYLLNRRGLQITSLDTDLKRLISDLSVRARVKQNESSANLSPTNRRGFHCVDGRAPRFVADAADSEWISTDSKLAPTSSQLGFHVATQLLEWHGADSNFAKAPKYSYFVQTDGEFDFRRAYGSPLWQACYRGHENHPETQFHDLSDLSRNWRCTSRIKTLVEKVGFPNWDFLFVVGKEDSRKRIDLMGQNLNPGEFPATMTPPSYLARVISEARQLRFEIYRRSDGEVMLEVTTPNSTLSFSTGVDDEHGEGLALECSRQD